MVHVYMCLLKMSIFKKRNVQIFTKQINELNFNTSNAVRPIAIVTISGKLKIYFLKVSDSEGKYYFCPGVGKLP